MKILAVTNMYPTPDRPHLGTFVGHQVKGLRDLGVEVEVLYLDRRREGMRVYRQTRRLTRARIRSFRPDLVHVMYGGVMARQVVREAAGLPVVLTLHGSDILGENHSGPTRKLISQVGVRCSRFAARRARRVVIVSRHLDRALPPELDRDRVSLIPCGIDLDLFTPMDKDECRARVGWDAEVLNVLFPANMGDPVKRPELARAAVRALNDIGVRAELRVLRGVPYDDVPIWMNASDVQLLTSHSEGSPTTVKEALACNVPVVSVDVGDVAERIGDIEGCYVVKPDPVALAEALRRVHGGRRIVDGREKMREVSIQRIAERLIEAYRKTLNGRSD